MDIVLQLIHSYASRHHGLITRSAAGRVGVSRDAWYRAVRSGVLIQIHTGVARVIGHPVTRHQTILAAVLACSESGNPPRIVAASHRTAAFLLGLPRPDTDPIEITITSAHTRQLEGVTVHRPTDLVDLSPTWRHQVPCTNELRTLVDLGAVEPSAVVGALEHFSVSRKVTPATVAQLLIRHGRSGRGGITALRAALDSWPLGDDIPDSELELAMARLLRDANLPPAQFHAMIAGYEVDFLIQGTGVIVECDGWTYHVASRSQWEFDLDRDARLHAAGYVVIRRTRRQILFDPHRTADLIQGLVSRRRAA